MLCAFIWFSLGSGAMWGGQGQEDPLSRARQLIRQGNYEGAIKLLEDYIAKIRIIAEQKKNLAEAYYIIAKTYYIVGEADNTEANLKRVFETYPAFTIDEPDQAFRTRVENVRGAVLAEQKGKAVEKALEKEQPAVMSRPGEAKKKKFPWLIVGGVVVAAGVVAVLLLKKKGSQNGAISVMSSPTGAKVYLDASDTGQMTNCTLSNISPGGHTVKLTKEGYQDYQQSVAVSGGQTASVNAILDKHTITVTSPTNSTVWEKGFEVEIKWTTDSSVKNSLNLMKNGLVQVLSPNLASPSDFHRERMQEQALTSQGRDPSAMSRNPKDLSGLGGIPGRIEGENPAGVNYPDENKNDNVSSMTGKINSNPENFQLLKNFWAGNRGQIDRELWGNDKSPNPLTALNSKHNFSITNVDIDLYKGGTKVQTIASNQSNTGSYRWVPPDSLADGTDYRVRISCSADSSVYGESSNYSIATHTYQFITKWGSFGTGDGQFNGPRLIAVDSSGNVYVADTANNRIQKFTSTGSFLSKWGSLGTGDGQFDWPTGIAVDSSGNVYITDFNNNRIQKFTSTGSFLSKWGSLGTGDGQFDWPTGIAVDSSGNVYITDFNNNRIQKFTSTGSFLSKWGSLGTGDGQFHSPSGIAVDNSGNIYVTEYDNNRIQKFTSAGSFLSKWGSYGTGDGQFDIPFGIAVDSSGNVYVTDFDNNRIQKFSSSGSFLAKWGSQGTGNGQFNYPRGIAVDSSGNVYVADAANNRIQKFTSTGSFLSKWGSQGTGDGLFTQPRGIAVDGSGYVFVADTDNNRIQKFR
jgi:DNA-binding beta-propeller fold protein YncE